ncbi:DNA-processing protein DprA [Nocardia wallacei]|uniref:DNA-processing protein DprA n=1 Tax=Nocardia wallacei TaxID=480035 RepID=UPI002456B989|nr:DNA-processing protein DprA [Nocardia wallacei]
MNFVVPEPDSAAAERLRAWAVLSRAAIDDAPRVHQLLAESDPVEAADRYVSGRGDSSVRRAVYAQAQLNLALHASAGGHVLTPDGDGWPHPLRDLLQLAPQTSPPVLLWLRGPARLDLFGQYRVAVTGASAASEYGQHVATDLAGRLASHGWTVVTRGGHGVDVAAHRGALNAAGPPTIAILAGGVDRPLPSQLAYLFDRIADEGLLVSQYPPRTSPRRDRIHAREALFAAMTAGVVVCEAGLRSSALRVARWARRLARPVAAVPGSVYSAESRGCHQLIRHGHAQLATDIDDVLDILASRSAHR